MRSGCTAATVFGATSAKISTTTVNTIEAIQIPLEPNSRMPITVAIEAARILTRLFPRRIKPIRRSGFCSSFCAVRAPRCPCLARCRRRYLFNAISPVSELEKKPERMIRMTRVMYKLPRGISTMNQDRQLRPRKTSSTSLLPKYANSSSTIPASVILTARLPRQP